MNQVTSQRGQFIKKIITTGYLLVVSAKITLAQVNLPAIPKVPQERYQKIEGAYTPRDNFLKTFPNFSVNGIYIFSLENMVTGNDDLYYFQGYKNFNSEDFPAIEEKSSKLLNGLGTIIVQLTTDTTITNPKIRMTFESNTKKQTSISSITDIDYFAKSIDYDKHVLIDYDIWNTDYRESVQKILNQKQVDGYKIFKPGSLIYDSFSNTNANLIFQFVVVQSNIWSSDKTAKNFPSHILYRLIVKDGDGEIINTYNQAIFLEAFDKAHAFGTTAIKTTFPIAMENLINRFLNDESTFQALRSRISIEKSVRSVNSHYDSILSYRSQYNSLRYKKKQLLFDLTCLEQVFQQISENNKDRESNVANRDRTLDNNVITSTFTGAAYGSWASEIRRDLEVNQKKLFLLQQSALSLKLEEKKFIDNLSSNFNNPFDIDDILKSKTSDDNALNNLFTKLTNTKNETFEAYLKTNKTISNDLGSVFTNNLSSFINSATGSTSVTNSSTVETMATTNGSTNSNEDACMKQANSEWYGSDDYKRYKKTGLNSDASDCKAKILELTAKYCGDKLPQNELALIKQQAVKERQLADQIRAANKFYLKP